jgi:uncharacterized protein
MIRWRSLARRALIWTAAALWSWTAAALWSWSATAQDRAPACPPTAQAPTPEQLLVAQAAARDRGFLWRLTRDGRSSWLYGTVHLGRLDWVFPGQALREALDVADTLALELDITDPATLREVAAAMAAGPSMPPLPKDLADRIRRRIAAACLPPQALDSQHPVMRVVTLTMLEARWDGLDPAFAQEGMLAGAARARRMPIVALETAAAQIAAVLPADPDQALEAVSSGLDQIESGAARRVAARLAKAWAEQQLDELARYAQWCECADAERERAQMQRLNDARNPALADGIERLHARGRRVLAAVGALHMTGPQALPQLLAQRGFAVERIAFPR